MPFLYLPPPKTISPVRFVNQVYGLMNSRLCQPFRNAAEDLFVAHIGVIKPRSVHQYNTATIEQPVQLCVLARDSHHDVGGYDLCTGSQFYADLEHCCFQQLVQKLTQEKLASEVSPCYAFRMYPHGALSSLRWSHHTFKVEE